MFEDFERYVKEAVSELPKEFKDRLDNVSLFVEDFPTPEQAAKFRLREERKFLLGLYEGVSLVRRGGSYGVGGHLPDKITLFRGPILSIARSREALKKIIKDTLFHEIGHHFGLSEEAIENASKKNRSGK